MAEFTQPHNLAYPVASDRIKDPNVAAKLADDIKALAVTANNAIAAEGARAEAEAYARAKWKKSIIPAGAGDVREYLYGAGKEGQYACLNGADASTLTGLPKELADRPDAFSAVVETLASGVVITINVYSVWTVAQFVCTSAPSTGDGWTRWRKTVFTEDLPDGEGAAGTTVPGFKGAATPLNSPTGPYNTMTLPTARVRYPMLYTFSSKRVRVHIRNHNWRSNTAYPGAINFTGIWWGPGNTATGAFSATPLQVHGAFSTPSDGAEWASKWINIPDVKDVGSLISFGYSGAPESVESRAGVWRDTAAGSANAISGGGLQKTAPFHIWLEFEVAQDTPVGMVLGSSGEAGTGSAIPMFQTGFQTVCRAIGAVPTIWAQSGTTMMQWEEESHVKWTQWAPYAKPDFAVPTVGQNDLYSETITLAETQARFERLVTNIKSMYTENVFVTTIPPRTGPGDETKRRAYNTWLRTLPFGVKDIFEVSAALSADDDTIRPEFDADGVHANELGGAAKAQAMLVRPMTYERSQAVLKFDTDGVPYF